MPDWFWYLIVFGYGAIVGSFLNVLIYRMPLGMSVSRPASHCPRCNRLLGFWDNIPLLSFLALGARCRYCRTPISWRYFTVELLTGSLWVALFAALSVDSVLFATSGYDTGRGEYGVTWVNFIAHALFASVLVAVIFIDLDHFIIPDELNWIGVALGVGRDLLCLALAWQAGSWIFADVRQDFTFWGWLPRSLTGALVYGGLLFLISFVGFIVYARGENETVAQTARRFFVFEEESESQTGSVPPVPAEQRQAITEDEEEGEAVRLRFSPGFLAAISALLLLPTLGAWSAAAFMLPLGAFALMSRLPGEPVADALRRFFRADDQVVEPAVASASVVPTAVEGTDGVMEAENGAEAQSDEQPGATATVVKAQPSEVSATAAQLAAEADQFAREAETGQHGAMGLGDVKLALAIGALLGPWHALLSLFIATASGALTGVGLAALHGKGLRLGIPFGPFMAFGAVIMMLYGRDLIQWYLRLVGMAG